jgi:hypothetical protein
MTGIFNFISSIVSVEVHQTNIKRSDLGFRFDTATRLELVSNTTVSDKTKPAVRTISSMMANCFVEPLSLASSTNMTN